MGQNNKIVEITEKALAQIQVIYNSDPANVTKGLRLGVTGGGCSGLSYKIEFNDEKENDNFFMYGNIKVIVDPKSSIYLKDVVLDFKDGLNGKGFTFNNPNAKNTCGCGESFSV